jgi:hypothetical protein
MMRAQHEPERANTQNNRTCWSIDNACHSPTKSHLGLPVVSGGNLYTFVKDKRRWKNDLGILDDL